MGPLSRERLSPPFAALAYSQCSSHKLHTGFSSGESIRRRNFQLGVKRSRSASPGSPQCETDQSTLHCTQKRRRVATNNRFTQAKSIYESCPLQNGRLTYASVCAPKENAYGKNRLKGCLPYHTSGQQVPSTSGFSKYTGGSLLVQSNALRSLYRTVCIHQANKANSTVPPQSRDKHNHISGRHAHISTITRRSTLQFSNNSLAAHSPRIRSQCIEVSANTNHPDRLPGIFNQHQHNVYSLTTNQSSRDTERDVSPVTTAFSFNDGPHASLRETGSNKASNPHCSFALSGLTECEDSSYSCPPRDMYPITRGNQRLDVVEIQHSSPLLLPNFEARGLHGDHIRRLPARLGSSIPTTEDRRTMDSRRSSEPYQPIGIEGSLLSPSVLFERECVNNCFDQDGQSDSHLLFEPDGEPVTVSIVPAITGNMELVSRSPDNHSCRVSPWQREHDSRLGVSTPSRQQQLAPMPCSVRCIASPFRPFYHGSICFQDEPSTSGVLQLETRSGCLSSRWIFHLMGSRISLSVPSLLPSGQGPIENPERGSHVCMLDSTSLANSGLVPTITGNADRLSDTTSRSRRLAIEPRSQIASPSAREELAPDRMAYLRQQYEMQGISQRVAELVINSWRGNTNSAYNAAWRKWHSWCAQRGVNPVSTSVVNIMQFLTDQFDSGLQYRTVNTLRSAISTTHPEIEGSAVGSHPLVSRLMKGMFNSRPPAPRYTSSWDVREVVSFLSKYKSATLSTLQLGKKAVTLLALVNADRCSDLAALDRDKVKWTPDGVEFTVVQLTKTRSSKRSSSPRRVCYSSFPDNSEICPTTVLRNYIQQTADEVTGISGQQPLFITSRKPFHRARPGTIGHWIKDVLQLAGIDTESFSAHSTRSASTSYAASKGVSISDILKAANWSSSSTFEQFYYRPNNSDTYSTTILQSTQVARYYCCIRKLIVLYLTKL